MITTSVVEVAVIEVKVKVAVILDAEIPAILATAATIVVVLKGVVTGAVAADVVPTAVVVPVITSL